MSSIDTIKLGTEVSIEDIDLTGWKKTTEEFVDLSSNKFIGENYAKNLRIRNEVILKFRYIPIDYSRKIANLLLVEGSIPKNHNGFNYEELYDWEVACDGLNQRIASFPGLPKLPDIRDWVIYGIDLCHNHPVGDNVSFYLEALNNGHYPHRKRLPFKPTGVIFSSDEISTTFYDKFAECKNQEAKGILRQETRIRSRRKLENKFGKKYPTLRDITKEKVEEILSHDLEVLHLDKPIMGGRLKVEAILSNYYNPSKVCKLLGYLLLKNTLTYEQIIDKGLSRSTISRYEKDIAAVGISSLPINEPQELPALTISAEENRQNCNKVLMDTRTLTDYVVQKGGSNAKETWSKRGEHLQAQERLVERSGFTRRRANKQIFQNTARGP